MNRRIVMGTLAALLGGVLGWDRPAAGDLILLSNGRRIVDAWIVDDDGYQATILIIKDGRIQGRLRIKSEDIQFVQQMGKPPEAVRLGAKPFTAQGPAVKPMPALMPRRHVGQPGARPKEVKEPAAPAKGTAEKLLTLAEQKDGRYALDRRTRERLMMLLGRLRDPDESIRTVARRRIVAMRAPAVPYLSKLLTDNSIRVRRQAAYALKEIRATGAIKVLIEALYAGTPEKTRIPHWNRLYMDAVDAALRATTRKTFRYNARSARSRKSMRKWLDWWNQHIDKHPEQFSDPVLERDDPKYEETLREFRELKLYRKSYPAPPDRRKY